MFGKAFAPYGHETPTYGPAIGESAVEHYVGARGYDGGIYNSPFNEGRLKDPFSAPGQFNPFMFMRPRRRRLNLLSIIQVMSIPFIIFAMNAYLFGFAVRNTAPLWCWFFFGFCLLLAAVFAVKACIVYRKQKEERWTTPWYLMNDDDTWFLFLAVAIAISTLLGLAVGEIVYGGYTQPYYTLSQLHSYTNVDPAAEGKAYLDAGAVDFRNASFVDVSHGVGYKNGDVYCVAPIKFGTDKVANYDFFAVGVNCCNGFPGDFNCFQNRHDNEAHGGLRVIDDGAIPFYKLAVMQADEEWGKSSPNPIFLTWMRNPSQKVKSYFNDASWAYFSFLAAFVVFEVACVGLMAFVYWKNRLWG